MVGKEKTHTEFCVLLSCSEPERNHFSVCSSYIPGLKKENSTPGGMLGICFLNQEVCSGSSLDISIQFCHMDGLVSHHFFVDHLAVFSREYFLFFLDSKMLSIQE